MRLALRCELNLPPAVKPAALKPTF